MLRLKSPYGYNKGIGVNFFYDGEFNDMVSKNLFARILLSFSCHPNAIKKIYYCLKHSGQYSCFLQATWFVNGMYDLERIMKIFNIRIEVFFLQNKSLYEEMEKKYKQKELDLRNVKNIDLIKRNLKIYRRTYFKYNNGKHFVLDK